MHQAASACDDYFAWNDFLTGGGNDHAEGGWSDRNYYGIALACSTGILNRTPYAYAAAWGMPHEAVRRHQAVCDAFGASASPWFQAVQDSQHRDTDVLMLYPLSLVACEERFGSWMVQYGYANYVTPRKLLEHGRVGANGQIEMAGRKFGTLAVLFEPLPPPGLLDFLEKFAGSGGKLIWSGPPPRVDLSGQPVLARWQKLFGVKTLQFGVEGQIAGGWQVQFSGALSKVPPQTILTDFLVDLTYPVEPDAGAEVIAKVGPKIVGTHRPTGENGSATFLGFRPRDDQSASLGAEVRTWFEILLALGAYPGSGADGAPERQPQRCLSHDPLRGVPVSQRHHEPRGALPHARGKLAGRIPPRCQAGPGNPRPEPFALRMRAARPRRSGRFETIAALAQWSKGSSIARVTDSDSLGLEGDRTCAHGTGVWRALF